MPTSSMDPTSLPVGVGFLISSSLSFVLTFARDRNRIASRANEGQSVGVSDCVVILLPSVSFKHRRRMPGAAAGTYDLDVIHLLGA